jgi:N-acetylglutamate synthase-like GNAT family acetyltransferase
MKIRRASSKDIPQITRLAESLGLDYPGLGEDRIWVAEEGREIAGIAALKSHADCDELVSLGVDPRFRGEGLGRRLVQILLDQAPGDVYLATIIPEFFEKCGFEKAARPPAGMKKDPAWCEGCPKELCAIMVRKSR